MKATRWSMASRILSYLFIVMIIAGYASTKITDRERRVTGKIPRPDHILVYDFAAAPPNNNRLSLQARLNRTRSQFRLRLRPDSEWSMSGRSASHLCESLRPQPRSRRTPRASAISRHTSRTVSTTA